LLIPCAFHCSHGLNRQQLSVVNLNKQLLNALPDAKRPGKRTCGKSPRVFASAWPFDLNPTTSRPGLGKHSQIVARSRQGLFTVHASGSKRLAHTDYNINGTALYAYTALVYGRMCCHVLEFIHLHPASQLRRLLDRHRPVDCPENNLAIFDGNYRLCPGMFTVNAVLGICVRYPI
jgi:hypothetical protein